MEVTAHHADGPSSSQPIAEHPPGGVESLGPIDAELISPLRDLGPDDFRQLIRLFLDEAASRVARLRALQDQGNEALLAGVAHTLRGTSAAFGAVRLGALCAEIEEAAPTAGAIGLAKLVDDVTLEFDRVRASLTGELG
jgi:HPt (histidine-containing phosphotransfer) domain-containing protein